MEPEKDKKILKLSLKESFLRIHVTLKHQIKYSLESETLKIRFESEIHKKNHIAKGKVGRFLTDMDTKIRS